MTTGRARFRLRLMGAAAVAVQACGLIGCASAPAGWPATTGHGSSLGAMADPAIVAHDRAPDSLLAFERFEYARRDASLNPVAFGPVVAQRQWPQPPQPLERRVRFHIWEQR